MRSTFSRPRLSFRPALSTAVTLAMGLMLATSADARPQKHLLTSTEKLAGMLADDGLVILHVGADRESFDGGHVPGARFLEWSSIAVERDGVANEFPTRQELRTTFSELGVGDGSTVVLYDAAKGLLSARAFVALELIGFRGDVSVLDGQLAAWAVENRQIQVGAPQPVEAASLTLGSDSAVVVKANDVKRALAGSAPQLVDSRSAAEWSGAKAGRDVSPMRAGHLPGARNVPWTEHLADGDAPRLKPLDELQALYADVNVEGPVVAYCRTGVKASHTYFVLRYLGYRPHLYDGSFIEWHADPKAPVEKSSSQEGAPRAR
ncbi:MAG: rhodanese-like domain-containing protein [Acidobacteriota bacterium]